MVVTLLYRGLRISGLHIGQQNAQRFFPAGTSSIEIHLDHLSILCNLSPRFWQDHPELQDPRLCVWLESKFPYRAPVNTVPHLELSPSGPGSFRLNSLPMTPAPVRAQSFPPTVTT